MNYLFYYIVVGFILVFLFELLYDWVSRYESLPNLSVVSRISIWLFWPIAFIIFIIAFYLSYKENQDV